MSMTTKVSRSERGSATTGIKVSRARPRKIKITRTTKANAINSVKDGNDPNRTGELGLHRGKEVADGFGNLDGVGSRSPENRNDHRSGRNLVSAVPKAHADAFVLQSVFYRGNVFQVDRSAVVLAND